MEIRRYKKTTELLIKKRAFVRVVKDIQLNYVGYTDIRFQSSAIQALQETADLYLVAFFSDAVLAMVHAKRVTFMASKLKLRRGQFSKSLNKKKKPKNLNIQTPLFKTKSLVKM